LFIWLCLSSSRILTRRSIWARDFASSVKQCNDLSYDESRAKTRQERSIEREHPGFVLSSISLLANRYKSGLMSGKLLVGQAGGATSVINASLTGVIDEARVQSVEAIWGMRRGAEGALAGEYVDLSHISPDQLEVLSRTPGAALGSSRHRLSDDEAEQILQFCRANDVRYFLYIGGNDSADTVHRLACLALTSGYELAAIAVPKTIDNDLPVTDHCPGYGSIARYVAVATMDSAKDTESMPTMYPVKIIEVMGRDAGWVAASASLGKLEEEDAPHLIYVPERPPSRQRFLRDIERVHGDFGRVVAVVTETLRDDNGHPFADPELSGEFDAFGHSLLRGTASAMCRLVQAELGLRSRYDKPGSLQRMSSLYTSSVDLAEAEEVGRAAVRRAVHGESDQMVTLVRDTDMPYRSHTGAAPLSDVANRQRLLPDEFLAVDMPATTEAFRRYALPLLGPHALPEYARLQAPNVVPREAL
jgi:6-phosphofructokinase